ncbi:MAG: glycine cleavage system protein GcvH [Salinisphaera sp.]|nr:glycine cleavage system protein GcvH [Salinisphaera sp.]MDN5938678.1 glycine cleavage system protein GcvH [Salinisphaera sp.]
MSEIPAELKFAKTHEWVDVKDGATVVVGISDYAQDALGDLVFVELPEVGDTLAAGDNVAVVESVKAASDIYAPLTGEITAVNEQLADAPELINEDCYGEGWLFKIEPSDDAEFDDLLDAEGYEQHLADEQGG